LPGLTPYARGESLTYGGLDETVGRPCRCPARRRGERLLLDQGSHRDADGVRRIQVAKDSGAVFKSVQAYALQCYQERDYDHKTTIEARFSDNRKTGEVSVVMRGIDATKYTMHISLDALGPNETEVKVRDLSASEAEHRLDGLKAAARGGAAVCT